MGFVAEAIVTSSHMIGNSLARVNETLSRERAERHESPVKWGSKKTGREI